jgi:hypothetical protein
MPRGAAVLFGFFVRRMFAAETTVLVHLQAIRVIFLVFHRVVVALLALGTRQGDFHAHEKHILSVSGEEAARCRRLRNFPIKKRTLYR